MLRAFIDLGHHHTPQPQLLAILEVFETRGEELVHYANLVDYLRDQAVLRDHHSDNPYAAASTTTDTATSLSLAELQIKAHAYLRLVAATSSAPSGSGSGTLTLEEVLQSYLIYDWKKPATGLISKKAFKRATSRVGFSFTRSEIRSLSNQFSRQEIASKTLPPSITNNNSSETKVAYNMFLEWATPSVSMDVPAPLRGLGPKRTASTMAKVCILSFTKV